MKVKEIKNGNVTLEIYDDFYRDKSDSTMNLERDHFQKTISSLLIKQICNPSSTS